MPTFSYTAIDPSGQRTSGNLSAAGRPAAYRELDRLGLTPLNLEIGAVTKPDKKETTKDQAEEAPAKPASLKRPQIILFTDELADLLDAGLQLDAALRILHERQDHPGIRDVSKLTLDQVREGTKFSDALRTASPSFDPLYRNMVAAGEASGTLPLILRRLADNLKITHELQSRVTAALIYPAFIIAACIGLVVVFMTVLLPQLTDLMTKSGQQLPLMTQMLVSGGQFLTRYWWLIIAIITALFLTFKAAVNTPKGRAWWDHAKLRIPLVGPLISGRFYASFCHGLANLVNNGIPLLTGLKLLSKATPNTYLQKHMETATEQVAEGVPFSRTLKASDAFPTLLSDIIAVGEQTGRLGHSLQKAADRYDKELEKRIARLTSMLTPIIITFVAIFVLIIALSIVSAMSQSISGIRR